MRRAPCKLLCLFAFLMACAPGCGAFGVDTFSGSVIALSFQWPLMQQMAPSQPILPDPAEHLELWAVGSDGKPLRLPADQYAPDDGFPGFTVRLAINPADPCFLDAFGNNLLSKEAQPGPDKDLQQQALVQHVRQVISRTTSIDAAGPGVMGKAPVPLLVMVRYLSATPPLGNMDPPAKQAQTCHDFINDPANPTHKDYYLGNPGQYTSPLSGRLYGFLNFSTIGPMYQTPDPATFLPPQSYGGIAIISRVNLHDAQALLLTRETAVAPPAPDVSRAVFQGQRLPPDQSGRGAIRFGLAFTPPPAGMPPMPVPPVVIGTASILTDLDQQIAGDSF